MVEPIRVETPDAASAADLMQQTVGGFDARLVGTAGGGWEVHFRPDREQSRLVLDVLALVEQWLGDRHLAWATLHLDGRTYTLRNDDVAARVEAA